MLPNEAKQAILSRWIALWGASPPTAYENQAFDPESLVEWVRLVVRHTLGPQETLGKAGNRIFRRQGLIVMQIFCAQDDGTSAADALAHAARAIFEGVSFDGIDCGNATLREAGDDKFGPWFQVNVEVFFAYDEVK